MKQERACTHCGRTYTLWKMLTDEYMGLRIKVNGKVEDGVPPVRGYEVLCPKCGENMFVASSDLVADEALREEMWKRILSVGPMIVDAAEKIRGDKSVSVGTPRKPPWWKFWGKRNVD